MVPILLIFVDPEDHQRRNNVRANYRVELSRFERMVSGLEQEQQRHQAASERGSAEETGGRRGQVANDRRAQLSEAPDDG